jgi:DNA-directed RNA polymerase subunit alpha
MPKEAFMDLKKRGFQLPDKMRFEEDTLSGNYGKLIAEPLERGFATTLGNAMRRVLLSSIEGTAVTGIRISNALHEFTTLEGVKEDVVDIILNVKELQFQMDGNGRRSAVVKASGPKEIKGGDLQVDSSVKVLNPEQLIATLDKGGTFEAEMYLDKGKGYVPAEMNKKVEDTVDVVYVDSVFSPVVKVNFSVEKARVGRSTDFDRLILEVWTNGALTPQAAISQAASILSAHASFFVFEKEEEKDEPEQAAASAFEETVFNENLLKSVEELELSVRAHNCLKNANIKTIADLVQKTEHDMLRTKNFGRKSLAEIKEILLSMGLNFGMRIDSESMQKAKGAGAKGGR